MIRTVAGYAREGGLAAERVEAMLATLETAVAEGTFLALAQQFLVTATA